MTNAHQSNHPNGTHSLENCRAVSAVFSRVGDRWSALVVMLLGNGPMRFNELKRATGGISQRMLTVTVRALERDGLVTRTVFPTIPPRVDYELTDLGRSFWEPVNGFSTWALTHQSQIEEAQRRFDESNSED